MLDGDEIDDIEEACVDEDSPPPKNRQRLSYKWEFQGEQGVIFMQQFKRVIVEKSHQQSQINRWQEDDIETYEGMKLVGCSKKI